MVPGVPETFYAAAIYSPDIFRGVRDYLHSKGVDQEIHELGDAIRADFTAKETIHEKLEAAGAIAAFATTLALEWGPTNEGLLAWVAGESLAHTSGVIAPIEIGAIAGAASVTTQMIYGTTAMGAIRSVPHFVEKSREIKESYKPNPTLNSEQDESNQRPSILKRVFRRANRAFILGSALSLTLDHSNQADRTVGEDVKSVAGSAAGIGSYVIGIGSIVGLSHFAGPEVSSFIGRNITKGVIGGIALSVAGKNIIKRVGKRNKNDRVSLNTEDDPGEVS